jgi:hypothetical protein
MRDLRTGGGLGVGDNNTVNANSNLHSTHPISQSAFSFVTTGGVVWLLELMEPSGSVCYRSGFV